MKLLADFFPVILFFIAYKLFNIYIATAVVIIASGLQLLVFWLKDRSVDKVQLTTFILILILGGATLVFHNPIFIKWKPTLVSWIFALAFLVSRWVSKKTLVEWMIGKQIILPSSIWHRLNLSWAGFLSIVGAINLWVAYTFTTNVWVNFKLFGMLGLTVLFIMLQGIYLSRRAQFIDRP